MSVPLSLDAAIQRLNAALTLIEDAVDRRGERDRASAGRETEVQALAEDRARLAQELDDSFVRFRRLDNASRDVSRRLDHAMETIRSVLGPQEG